MAAPPMATLAEQRAFVLDRLDRLGRQLGLAMLADHALELEADDTFKAGLEAAVADVAFFRTKHWESVMRLGLYRLTQYALVRALKPTGVVETGVLHGLSTAFTLAALARNAAEGTDGRMISIDYPSTFEDGPSNRDGFDDTLPPDLAPGWAIPAPLRARWRLRIGPSRDHLEDALADLGGIGLFIHDSEHTEATMRFEFDAAWAALESDGVLLADNIDVNTSFFDFALDRGRPAQVLPVDPDHHVPGGSGIRFGVIRKQSARS